MNAMTLPSRHRIRNLSSNGLRASTIHLGPRNNESLRKSGEETFCVFETWIKGHPSYFAWMSEWGSSRRSSTFQAGSFNHCTRAPAINNPANIMHWLFVASTLGHRHHCMVVAGKHHQGAQYSQALYVLSLIEVWKYPLAKNGAPHSVK